MIIQGTTVVKNFHTQHSTTGALTDATSLPTGTLFRNGAATAEVVTVTKTAATTGRYSFSVVIPAGWTNMDSIEVGIDATTDIAGFEIVWADVLYQAIATLADTDDIQTRLPAALVGGRIDASVGAMATDSLTADALAADAVAEISAAAAGDTTDLKNIAVNQNL